jgi:hypothetical protein
MFVNPAIVAVAIAERFGAVHVGEHALSALVWWAREEGVEHVLDWIEDDPGLTIIPSWPFWEPSWVLLSPGYERGI